MTAAGRGRSTGWQPLGGGGVIERPDEAIADPFAMTADPAGYLRREACEAVLAELGQHLMRDGIPAALTGPPGLGKTLLLRVLARRLEGRARPVYLPYSALEPEGLCAWALGELGLAPGPNPEAELVEHAQLDVAMPLVLLIDEGALLPVPTARGLADLCAVSGDAMRLVLAATDGIETGRVLAALGPFHEVRLRAPMTAPETMAYVRWRLARAELGAEIRSRFEREMERLVLESSGVPRRVHQIAEDILLLRPRARDGQGDRRRAPDGPRRAATRARR